MKDETPSNNQGKVKTADKVAYFVIAVLAIGFFMNMCSQDTAYEKQLKLTGRAADARKDGQNCLTGWSGWHKGAKRYLMENLKDPESFEHISTKVAPRGGEQHEVTMRYRARNSFGGMSVETLSGIGYDSSCYVTSVRISK